MIEAIILEDFEQSALKVERIDHGLYRLIDSFNFMCYLVVGTKKAALIDTMSGIGNLPQTIERILSQEGKSELEVDVFLTHHHIDHCGGAYWFNSARFSPLEDGRWTEIEQHANKYVLQMPHLISAPINEENRPEIIHVSEGDSFSLGNYTIEVFLLPGHTKGSTGYLIKELGILLSGDAVTPIMCLCFEDSLSIPAWQRTLSKMKSIPFTYFLTGHHQSSFGKDSLDSFISAGTFAENDRGIEWYHGIVEDWKGTCHLCPCETFDADSPNFRAVITPGLPRRRKKKSKSKQN